MLRQAACILAGALLATAGCGHRIVGHRVREPLAGSVDAAPTTAPLPLPGHGGPRASRTRPIPSPPPVRVSIPAEPLRATGTPGDELAARLRDRVGDRDATSSHLQFAIDTVASLGARIDPRLRATDDGPALRDLASERGALIPGDEAISSPELGDLLLFDRTGSDQPASLVAVVVSTDSRHVIEFIYLARGVVRRGYLSRAHPTKKRDTDGRALNTFIRHSDGNDPPGTRHLAGELYAAHIRLDRLLR